MYVKFPDGRTYIGPEMSNEHLDLS